MDAVVFLSCLQCSFSVGSVSIAENGPPLLRINPVALCVHALHLLFCQVCCEALAPWYGGAMNTRPRWITTGKFRVWIIISLDHHQ